MVSKPTIKPGDVVRQTSWVVLTVRDGIAVGNRAEDDGNHEICHVDDLELLTPSSDEGSRAVTMRLAEKPVGEYLAIDARVYARSKGWMGLLPDDVRVEPVVETIWDGDVCVGTIGTGMRDMAWQWCLDSDRQDKPDSLTWWHPAHPDTRAAALQGLLDAYNRERGIPTEGASQST